MHSADGDKSFPHTKGASSGRDPLLAVEHLVKYFPVKRSFFSALARGKSLYVHAVDDVSFSMKHTETFALVGESGSGKTTLGLTVLGLTKPTAGRIVFDNQVITEYGDKEMRNVRRYIHIVFQDPTSSLDPRMSIIESVSEPLVAYGKISRTETEERVSSALTAVGLDATQMHLFPHQFSGGQRQRICIARAIIHRPKLILLDEPTSSLDASVQSQILLLLLKLQSEFELSYLLITHNASVARYMADRIGVMYIGKIVELGSSQDVMERSLHPYTKLLISSVLEPDVRAELNPGADEGEIPSSISPPRGCRFNTRCMYSKDLCREVEPELREFRRDHYVACHYAEEIS